jgi:hypothetical protein
MPPGETTAHHKSTPSATGWDEWLHATAVMLGGGDGQRQLIRSDRTKTGYKGVVANFGRYKAKCTTPPCSNNRVTSRLGTFDTPEDAAQAYLQHYQKKHPEELEKERAPRAVLPEVQEHLLVRSGKNKTGYKGVHANKGRYNASCTRSPCHTTYLGTFVTPEDAARAYLQHQKQEHEHAAELKNVKPLAEEEEEEGHAVSTDKGKKRKQQPQPTPEMERLSDQLHSENQALKRCKQEFVEEDHAALNHTISEVEAAVQCSICSDTMKQASTLSGCGHTFCRGCIEEDVRVKGCCPVCRQPVWHRDITHARLLSGVMAELDGFRSEAPL